jgi:hypothetical protein
MKAYAPSEMNTTRFKNKLMNSKNKTIRKTNEKQFLPAE